MKVSVYAVETEENWKLWISLYLVVDRLWWSGAGGKGWNGRHADKLVLLSPSLPLGWAVKLRERFRFTKMMSRWSTEEWADYLKNSLKGEIQKEAESGGRQQWTWFKDVEIIAKPRKHREQRDCRSELCSVWESGRSEGNAGNRNVLQEQKEALGAVADRLAEAISGRSLLQPELEALLAEQLAGMERDWPAAAQLAHLQGRLELEAAVSGGLEGTDKRDEGSRFKCKLGKSARGDYGGSSCKKGEGARGDYDGSSCKKGESARGDYGRLSCKRGEGSGARRSKAGLGAALRLPLLLLTRGAARRRAVPRCLRCGSVATGRTPCAACGLVGCAYCEACLALGRSRACALLLRSAASPAVLRYTAGNSPTAAARRWGLSSAQAGAAAAALGFLAAQSQRAAGKGPERFLLWAVTGAGKTEITFPLLEAVLAAGGRALVATPRRDVVLELAPRLARAFPAETIAVLYGGSQDRWVAGQLTIATTHQLLRFHQGFDLVVIDELDAYPYHNDPMLAFAAEQACKPDGAFIFLSATPPQELQRQVRSGRLPHARVPVRFHGHPLPVPQHVIIPSTHSCLKRGRLPQKLLQALRKSLNREAQIFLFVSRIAHIEKLLVLLRRSFPGVVIEGTSSKDPWRANKVVAFRGREISLLVTTTILERGVTVPRSDVFILDADSSLFDEASLVQMAGRAGRSKDDPAGRVIFASPQWNGAQRGAISQIRTMNAIARRAGYLRGVKS